MEEREAVTWRPLPTSDSPPPERLGGALDRLARNLGAPGAEALAVVFSRWAEIVGPATAAFSRPLWLARGTLVVAVDDPGRATELRYGGAEVLDRLAAAAGHRLADRLEVRVRPSG